MTEQGLISADGNPAAPPYRNGPYIWDQHLTLSQGLSGVNSEGAVWYVDGTNGTSGNNGKSWTNAFATIQAAIDAASKGDTIYVTAKDITDQTGDPNSYEENLIIPNTASSLSIIGVSRGRTQGGLPQLKDGSGTTTAILIIRAPGCLIANLGINGAGNTGGGILLDDDYSTKSAFATTIQNCHLKNCKGATATDSRTGGAIMWSAQGNAWQCRILGNHFYKNAGDIVLKGTGNTRPQDIVIEGNFFQSAVTSVCDSNIYGAGGGFQTVAILNNIFGDVPAVGSGSIALYIDLTGTQGGVLAGNLFGQEVQGGSKKTFGASGDAAKIPETVIMAGNYGEADTEGDSGYVYRTG